MPHTLSVTVHADRDSGEIFLAVSGCLTERSQQALHPVVSKVCSLDPAGRVIIDVTAAGHIDLEGVELLKLCVQDMNSGPRRGSVQFVAPDLLPVCQAGSPSATAA